MYIVHLPNQAHHAHNREQHEYKESAGKDFLKKNFSNRRFFFSQKKSVD